MTSPFNWASQLGSNVSISNLSSFLCSAVSPATHLSLSNFKAGGSEALAAALVEPLNFPPIAGETLGGPKKEVRSPFFLGFFASSPVEVGASLRLRDDIADA